MSDIVKRLRARGYGFAPSICNKAADEIERLRSSLAESEALNSVMRETLEGIRDADWPKWEELASPDEFVAWAKRRANHALIEYRSRRNDSR